MQLKSGSRWLARIEDWIFVVLFLACIGLLAFLSNRYRVQYDWTATGRNTLSSASQSLLERLDGPLNITAYAREDPLVRQSVLQLVERYRRSKDDIGIEFVDPDRVPDEVRRLGVTVDGELIVSYQGRREHAKALTEQAVSSAIERTARAGERWIVFLTGHGERSLLGQANHDLGALGAQLESRGFTLQPLDLTQAGTVPANSTLLVVSQPLVNPLPGEIAALREYVEQGGNLLWLSEPGEQHGLEALGEVLGVSIEPGVLVDPNARTLGVKNATFIPVTSYGIHPITAGFDLITLFPRAAGVTVEARDAWEADTLLSSDERAWSETGPLASRIQFDEDADVAGPLAVGVALRRPYSREGEPAGPAGTVGARVEQRVVVIGDGDFLSNAYLGNGGNLDLGMNIINWLASDDVLIDIPVKHAPDLDFEIDRTAALALGFGALLVVPLIFLSLGLTVWLRRRNL